MNFGLMFPGQGAQTAGFLHALPDHPEVRETLHDASVFLGHDVLALDNDTALAGTVATQISLLVAEVAFARFLEPGAVQPAAVAGMSVGAYAAAVCAGATSFPDALMLVRRRAELMEAAFPAGTHGMVVVEGLRLRQVKMLIEGTGVTIANLNSDTQHVLAGLRGQLATLAGRALGAGAHTARLLRMSVASHTPDLLPAAQELLEAAKGIPFRAPRVPMYSNRTARPLLSADAVRDELAFNMAYPVRWHDTVTALGGIGVSLLVEAPPGRTLTGLATSILPDVPALAAGEMRWDVILREIRRK